MVRKVVLAYSGGLDTSIIIPWLKENYGCEVIAMAGDVGQEEELEGLEEKALKTGASKLYVEDLKQAFVQDYVWPSLRAGAIFERKYLLGTSMARPILAKRQVEIAIREGADALAHGCTGKGNDQVRFELTYMALAPHLQVIAPWREWDIKSREDAIDYAHQRRIPITASKEKIYSEDRTCGTSATRADRWKTRPPNPKSPSGVLPCRRKRRPTDPAIWKWNSNRGLRSALTASACRRPNWFSGPTELEENTASVGSTWWRTVW